MSVTGKNDEATFTIKYQGIPLNTETTMHVLGTDYDSYAVLWSCNSVAGPVGHTGKMFFFTSDRNVNVWATAIVYVVSAWILTRERVPDGPVLQAAYGVLDRYKISRTFFVNTDQTDCETKGAAEEADDEPPSSNYDIVVDDDTVTDELFVNHYGNIPVYHDNNNYYRENGLNATVNANATSKSTESIESTTSAAPIKRE